MIPAILNEVFI